MNDSELIREGMTLMAFGMGFVFVFLTLLVFATTGMSKLVARWGPLPVMPEATPRPPVSSVQGNDLVAVISTAVHRYRQRNSC